VRHRIQVVLKGRKQYDERPVWQAFTRLVPAGGKRGRLWGQFARRQMKYLHLTLPTPEENLALDEALLELAESDGIETLRVWESAAPFVVLGLSNHASREINLAECERRQVPVRRRCSGGGTVVQGPGCLSYALTLRIPDAGPLAALTTTNRFVMERNRAAFEALVDRPVAVRGHTDLETDGRKFSGNAQRRGRRALLFHGTILYAADLGLIDELLHHPSREPDWRDGRKHIEFIANFPANREQLTTALRQAWTAHEPASPDFAAAVPQPLISRHTDPAWIHRLT